MNFFETNLGRTFFQVQVPKLISALTEIAEALRTPRPAVQVQTEIPKNFLTDLYHGNLEPSYAEDTPEIATCSQQIMQLQKKLYQGLSQDNREQIEDYRTLLDERYVRQAEQAFAAGFRCAMTMLAAGLSAPDSGGTDKEGCHNENRAD